MLLNKLKTIPGATTSIYLGTENVTYTISLFHRADAVLMYHGAAAANLVFCRRFAFALEVTTYSDISSSSPWRSNFPTLRQLRPDLVLLVYRIPLAAAFPHVDVRELESAEDRDALIKQLENVTVSSNDADNITSLISTAYRRTQGGESNA